MRILLGADQYPEYINGAANFTVRLARGLAGRGHAVDLLWPSAQGRPGSTMEDGVRIHRLTSIALPAQPRMHVCAPWSVGREVSSMIKHFRPDVVHVQSHLSLGRALVRAARSAGLPIMATNHFMPENLIHHIPVVRRFPERASQLAWRDLERVFAQADVLSAPTERAVELLSDSTSLPRALAISCGIDLSHYPPRAAIAPDHPTTVLFVGRLEQEKHVDELLTAFALVPPSYRSSLEIVGMGSLRRPLEALGQDLGLRGRVTFHGALSDEDLARAYARADVFVMPGTAELQSLATLEAMASGLPVIAADAMALPHLVTDGINGYLFPPGDVSVLADRLRRLVVEPGLGRKLGRASGRLVKQHSLGRTLTTLEACYTSLVRAADQPLSSRRSADPAHALAS